MCYKLTIYTGMSNIKLGGQNWPCKDSNLAQCTALENMKECIDFEVS